MIKVIWVETVPWVKHQANVCVCFELVTVEDGMEHAFFIRIDEYFVERGFVGFPVWVRGGGGDGGEENEGDHGQLANTTQTMNE